MEPYCAAWASLVDNGTFTQNDAKNALSGMLEDVDVIILACTHYVTISDIIKEIVGPDITIINPFDAVSRYVDKILSDAVINE